VDVCAAWLDASVRGVKDVYRRFENRPAGIAALAGFCREHDVDLVVMEATGGHERLAFGLLWAEGVPSAIVNPRSVRQFAEAMGLLEKTDRIDAEAIAWYAEAKRIVPRPPATETQQTLAAAVTRLRQLVELRTMQSNQRRLVRDIHAGRSFDELLALVGRQIRELECRIVTLIGDDPLWAELDRSFRSVKGVAGRTVARLLAEMPEIGTISGKAIAKLAGLAPLAKDSGKRTGRRSVRGGRSSVRSILFMVAAVVAKHEPDLRAFSQKLAAAGKPKKAIRVAVARKLLVRLNAKARDVRAVYA
jgi:transposase